MHIIRLHCIFCMSLVNQLKFLRLRNNGIHYFWIENQIDSRLQMHWLIYIELINFVENITPCECLGYLALTECATNRCFSQLEYRNDPTTAASSDVMWTHATHTRMWAMSIRHSHIPHSNTNANQRCVPMVCVCVCRCSVYLHTLVCVCVCAHPNDRNKRFS